MNENCQNKSQLIDGGSPLQRLSYNCAFKFISNVTLINKGFFMKIIYEMAYGVPGSNFEVIFKKQFQIKMR